MSSSGRRRRVSGDPSRVQTRGNMFHYGHFWSFNPWTLRTAASLAGPEELDATRARSAGTISFVFRIGSVREAADLVNTENASPVRDLIARPFVNRHPIGRGQSNMYLNSVSPRPKAVRPEHF